MKKIKLFPSSLLLLLFMVNTAVSQQLQSFENGASFNFGFKGGLNQSTQAGYNNEDITSRPGYQFGVFISNNFLEEWLPDMQNLQLRVELNYLRSGARINDNNLNRILFWGTALFVDEELHGFNFERNIGGPFVADEIFEENIYSTFTYHYIESPFLVNYSLPMGVLIPYVFAGPSFSMLVDMDYSFTLITEDNNSYTQSDIDETVNQQIRKFNIGANLGLGIRLPAGLFMEAHYSFGFTDTMEFYDNRINNRGLIANIGFQF